MKLLVASMFPTHPTTVGNRARIRNLCAALQQLGHELHFAYIAREPGDLAQMRQFFGEDRFHATGYRFCAKERLAAWRLWRRLLAVFELDAAYSYGVDDWYDPALAPFFRKLAAAHRFDMVIAEYVFLSRALAFFGPDTVKVIDTHDRFSDRHRMFLAAGQWPGWFSTSPAEEVKAFRRADAVLAIQEREREFFAARWPGGRVLTVGHLVATTAPVTDWQSRQPYSMLIVGIASPPNQVALQFFLEQVFPRLRRRVPQARLLVAGSLCESVGESAGEVEGVHKLGVVDDIGQAYAQAWIAVNPVLNGTGMCIKSAEALGYGLPLVVTATGARGLEEFAGTGFVAVADRDADAMVEALAQLLTDEAQRTRLSARACAAAAVWNRRATATLETLLAEGRAAPVAA